jgi:hypothetical protein
MEKFMLSDSQNQNEQLWYDVQIEDDVRRVQRVGVSKNPHIPVPAQEFPEAIEENSQPSILRLMWRALGGVLEKLGPDDPPRIIAIIRAPERMYCAACGTQRVARYCPICGANVDRQYQKMVRLMARYVVDASSQRRESIESAIKAEVERQVQTLARQQREQIHQKMQMLERAYVMEIVRQKQRIDSLTAEVDRHKALPAPAQPSARRGE